MLGKDRNIGNQGAGLQQRVIEYLAESKIASADVLATVLEEMIPFQEQVGKGSMTHEN